MALNFNRIWASSQNPAYPTDAQTARGLSFLGTEEPTFDLHDAMFQGLDLQDKWLYDQVRLACERFGQKVQNDDGSVIDGARDAMANAITTALLTQRKADEGGYGIVKMANADTTKAGQEYNQAVSPKHLAEYVSDQNTWTNTKDKPQTATRWPTFAEVTNKPIYGDIVWSNAGDFDPIGSANTVNSRLDSLKQSLSKIATSGQINDASGVLDKSLGGTNRSDNKIDFDSIIVTATGGNGGVVFQNQNAGPDDKNRITSSEDDSEGLGKSGNINIDTWNSLAIRSSYDSFKVAWKINGRNGNVHQTGDISLHGDRQIASDGGSLKVRGSSLYLGLIDAGCYFYNKNGSEVAHVDNDGNAFFKGTISGGGLKTICFDNSIDNTYGSLSWERVSDKPALGNSARRNVFDTSDASLVPYNGELVTTASTVAAVRDNLSASVKSVSDSVAGVAGKTTSPDEYSKIAGSANELLTTQQFKSFLSDITAPRGLHSYAMARPSNPSTGNLITGTLMSGADLTFCSASGDTAPSYQSLTVGTWRLMGNVFTQASEWPAYVRIASLWVRVL